eukprot:m.11374 g.11374  ORF g.11374 m.11374 type:complete len:268 (+) comp23229_c0_seq1:53-856(+)
MESLQAESECHQNEHAVTYCQLSRFCQESDAVKFLNNVLKPRAGDRVLDFGCGTGNVTADLVARVGKSGFVLGVDPDLDRIAVAKERLQKFENALIVPGTIDEACAHGKFDVVNSNHVVHWIPKDQHKNVVEKIFNILKPGGHFGFTTINRLGGFLTELSGTQFNHSYEQFLLAMGWTFAPLTYWEAVLTECGFEVEFGLEESRNGGVFPSAEAVLKWWEATCVGRFKADAVDREEYQRLLARHGHDWDKPVPIRVLLVDVVARKPK